MYTEQGNGSLSPQFSHKRTRRAEHVIFLLLLAVGCLVASIWMLRSSANRQRGQFINQDFRNQNPNTGNIIYSLYGDGTPGNTSYTRIWNGGCIPSNVVLLPSSFAGGTGADDTIYVINSGDYTLTNNIVLGTCSALIGHGEVYIRGTTQKIIGTAEEFAIVDNLDLSGVAIYLNQSDSITLHGLSIHHVVGDAITVTESTSTMIAESQIYENNDDGILLTGSTGSVINNIMSYNNDLGMEVRDGGDTTINNSQFFNNNTGVRAGLTSGFVMNANAIYNNHEGFSLWYVLGNANDTIVYNNDIGGTIAAFIDAFGNIKFFDNTVNTGAAGIDFSLTGTIPAGVNRTSPTLSIDTESIDHDWVTNPLSLINDAFFASGIINWSAQRGTKSFAFTDNLRYIFGMNILRQRNPVAYIAGTLVNYGSDGEDFDSTKYITELQPHFTPERMSIVNQYFGSGSRYTQNRSGNSCSLGSFQVVTLSPGNYAGGYTLQDHSIYILQPGEYTFNTAGNGFTFGGNCIALVGSGDVVIDKSNTGVPYLLYADGKRNLILDNLNIDGKYYGGGSFNGVANIDVNFAGATYNTTINQVQAYNASQYGIFLGANSHHNTIINTQTYNNLEAGMYLYLASHHNVINNSMAYNNSGYGIRFANGSHRNAMNNFQSFNNTVGIFGDLTTKENIINRAMLYNNSEYGMLLKNSSGNILNDLQIYNNATGIKVEFGSVNNIYNGELNLFDNTLSDLDGTTADDGYLNVGSISPFSIGVITLGSGLMDCSYVTNPNLSGTTTYLLNTLSGCTAQGPDYSVFSGLVTNINYLFGVNIYKQTIPASFDISNAIQTLPDQYDDSKYIAEIFPIRDTILEDVVFFFSGTIEPSTTYTSEAYTAHIINTSIPIELDFEPTAANGTLLINGSNIGTDGTIVNGDTIQIRLTSSPNLNGVVTGTLLVNNILTYTVTLTTKGPDETPDLSSFAFTNIVGAPLSTYTGSMTTVTGIETGVLASIDTGWIAIYSGGALISSGSTGMVYEDNEILAMIQSSDQYSTAVMGTVTIGLGSGSFTVRTIPDIYSPIISFTDPVSSGAVYEDTISVIATGNISPLVYKFVSSPADCNSSGTTTYSGSVVVNTEIYNGLYFCVYAELSGYDIPLVSQYPLNIDRSPPTTPIPTYPEDEEEIFFVVLERTGVYESGAGISGYEYMIAEDYNFIDIISTGFVQMTGNFLSPYNFTEIEGDFYRKVRALDNVGLYSSRSNQRSFVAMDNEDFYLHDREYAALEIDYLSNEITIDGLRTHGLAYAGVDEGTIYKNGVDKGQSTYVQNDDVIAIENTSSDEYDDNTISTLTVANRSTDFVITTIGDDDECTLSDEDKEKIQLIFDSLIAQYSGNQDRYEEFLHTMESMLQDEIDLTNDCNLQYLHDLIHDALFGQVPEGINLNNHIAPNCKEYRVSYDSGKVAFTSPDFRYPTYYANRDSLTRYIDNRNPGDCHISTSIQGTRYFTNTDPSKHIASNGKVYTIQSDVNGYSSNEMSTRKYFSTLLELRRYIDSKNPPYPIWNHTVDISFTPINHTAPNGKVYKIYKTSRGYMSYKLMNVRYYTTLDDIIWYIDRNNPK